MAVQSKAKGNTWERKIANYLSERFRDYVGVESPFRRATDSGAWVGGSNQSRAATHLAEHVNFGDIICPPNFKWTVECKHYKTQFTLNSILLQTNTQLDAWLDQARQDATNAGKQPLLIVKFNNCEPFVLSRELHTSVRFNYHSYHCYLLNDFFGLPDAQYFLSEPTKLSVVS